MKVGIKGIVVVLIIGIGIGSYGGWNARAKAAPVLDNVERVQRFMRF